MKKIALSVLLIGLLAACSSTPLKDPSKVAVEEKPVGQAASTAAESKALEQKSAAALDPLQDPSSQLAKRSVYFDFDMTTIKDEDKETVQTHAKHLAGNRNMKARLEGHADERGSREYNLALGQRRAESVKKAMSVLGAQDAQIETISFGEEKPKAAGHDEAAWAENRRVDIKHQGE